jgi:hypothetical protein
MEVSGAVPPAGVAVSADAWRANEGGYDMHLHVGPDVIRRRIDDLALARTFLEHGLRGFVLKSHYLSTAERAQVVTRAVPGINVFGALTLNHSAGGLNPVAVDIAGRGGARTVWMPTVDAANETAGREEGGDPRLRPAWADFQRSLAQRGIAPPPLSVLGTDGALTAEARLCLQLIGEYDMILATGHLGRREIFALVAEARHLGLRRVVVTHAEFPSQSLTVEEQAELAAMGAFIEHCFTTPHTGKAPWDVVFAAIRAAGPARCVISTDLGQPSNPPVAEGFAAFAQRLLDAGLSLDAVRRMAVENTAALLEPDRVPQGG